MARTVITGRILKWGNSYGVRIGKAELEAAGLKPGVDVILQVVGGEDKIDLSGLPVFRGGRPDDSVRHDEVLGEALLARLEEKRRRST